MKRCITTCARIRKADCEARDVTQDEDGDPWCYGYHSRFGRWAGVGVWARCPCCRSFIIAHGCVVDQHKVNAGLFSLFLGINSPEYDCDGSGHVAIEYEREENDSPSVMTDVCKPSPFAQYKFDAFWDGVNRSLDEAREKGDVTHHLPWSTTPAVFKKKKARR